MLKAMFTRSALLGALPVVVALMLSGVISFSYNRLLRDYRSSVEHTFQAMAAIDNVLLSLQDAETGQRGFIITGDDAYLAPFQTGAGLVSRALADLDRLVSDNTAQQSRVDSVRRLADAKLAELEDTIATRKAGGFEAARGKVAGNAGKETMDRIRDFAATMRDAETRLLESRVADARFAERMMILVAALCVALSLAGRLAAFLISKRRAD